MAESMYIPKFTVTGKAMCLIAEIAAALERYKILMEGPEGVRLRKQNRIKTLRGTTAIEGNTLTEDEITAILAGKRVKGSRREIEEVKGAHRAYEMLSELSPLSAKDLLKAHAVLTEGLVESPGKWRRCNVGVVNGRGKILHQAPPWDHVPFLMKDLFSWLRHTKDIPLVTSCVFHCMFETIHPFPDGNGRMGRLWQTAILGKWNPLFYAAPVEDMVFSHQQQYYRALHSAQAAGDATVFVDFMLDIILRTIKARGVLKTTQKTTQKHQTKTTQKKAALILALLAKHPNYTTVDLVHETGLSTEGVKWNLRKLKDAQQLRRIGPDKGGRWEVVG